MKIWNDILDILEGSEQVVADNTNTEAAEVNKTAEEVLDSIMEESETTKIKGIKITLKFPLFTLK